MVIVFAGDVWGFGMVLFENGYIFMSAVLAQRGKIRVVLLSGEECPVRIIVINPVVGITLFKVVGRY